LGAVDASERVSDLLLRTWLFFLKNSVRVSQKNCRATIKEVESRLREKFSELKPGAAVPSKIGDVIGALMSENGAFKFCDTTTTSGRDYRRGIQSLFEGIMAAYRNPAAHANLQYEKREAMEQIMLASQLMYVLDKPQL
jgi:hypothetical protein